MRPRVEGWVIGAVVLRFVSVSVAVAVGAAAAVDDVGAVVVGVGIGCVRVSALHAGDFGPAAAETRGGQARAEEGPAAEVGRRRCLLDGAG